MDWSQTIDNLVNQTANVEIARLAAPSTPVSATVSGKPYVEGQPASPIAGIPQAYLVIGGVLVIALIAYAVMR